MNFETKEDVVRYIVKNSEDWIKVKGIKEKVNELTGMSVSKQRVHQVIRKMDKENKVKVDHELINGTSYKRVRVENGERG